MRGVEGGRGALIYSSSWIKAWRWEEEGGERGRGREVQGHLWKVRG